MCDREGERRVREVERGRERGRNMCEREGEGGKRGETINTESSRNVQGGGR